MKPIIKVENLSKEYRIGVRDNGNVTVREALGDALRSPLQRRRTSGRRTRVPQDGKIWALKDLSFEVQPGEALGIIGRNGAGKSTLLKILSRITRPTSGHVQVRGRVASLLQVGTGFHPDLTGRENVFLNGAILGMKRAEIIRKFDEIVAFSEIEKFLETPVKYYSSGMYMRLAFAVAAHLESEILVMDEVLAVGDVVFQQKCLSKMDDVARAGHAVVFVSHDLTSMLNLCARTILLEEGIKRSEGPTREVINTYLGHIRVNQSEWVCDDVQTAPGNKRIRLHAVRVVSNGKVTAEVDIQDPVRVEIEYWALQPNARVQTRVQLLEKSGVVVLTSVAMPDAHPIAGDEAGNPSPPGLYRAVCTFPGNFLNDNHYRVGIRLLADLTQIELSVPDIVSFSVHDNTPQHTVYGRSRMGVVRPHLDWQTEYLGAADEFAVGETS